MNTTLEKPDYLGELQRLAAFEARLEEMLTSVREDRDKIVREALGARMGWDAVAKAAGLSHARIAQLRRGQRR